VHDEVSRLPHRRKDCRQDKWLSAFRELKFVMNGHAVPDLNPIPIRRFDRSGQDSQLT
jgi:hypothetical protein